MQVSVSNGPPPKLRIRFMYPWMGIGSDRNRRLQKKRFAKRAESKSDGEGD